MKKLLNKIGSITLIILLAIHFSYAGDKTKVGTVAGVQLLVPVGARSIAMGQAIIADVTGAEALYWNPAGISSGRMTEFTFSNMSYIADININYFGAVYYGGNMGSIGLFLKSFDFGDIPETTEDYPDGTGRFYSPSFLTAGVAYARAITNLIDAGFTVKYVYEGIMQTNASTIALDMGVQYRLNENMKIGVVMSNVGGKLQYDGRNLERKYPITDDEIGVDDGYYKGVTLASNVPSQFSIGFSYKRDLAEGNVIRLNGVFNSLNEYSDQMGVGVEYAYNDMVFLRAGYTSDYQADDEAKLFDYKMGAGVKLNVGQFKIMVDYTYMNVKKYFDSMNIFSVKIGL